MTNTFIRLSLIFLCFFGIYSRIYAETAPKKEQSELPSFLPLPGEQPPAEHPENLDRDLMGEFLRMMFYLGLILALFVGVSWYLKKATAARNLQINETSLIKILESRHLSPKSMIHVIEIEDVRFIVGETPAGITNLGQLNNKE